MNTTTRKLTDQEWEDLCDGCGNCCEVRGPLGQRTGVACPQLDTDTRRCRTYDERLKLGFCEKVTPENTMQLFVRGMLPPTCAYVRHLNGQDRLPQDQIPVIPLIPYTAADRRVVAIHEQNIDG